MKKVLILVLTLILFVAACGNNNDNKDSSSKKDSNSDTKSFTMDNGKKVDVPKNPKRIAVLHPTYVGALVKFDHTPVAVPEFINQNKVLKDVTKDAKKIDQTNVEQVAKSKPDLIITSAQDKNLNKLKKIAPTVTFDAMTSTYKDNTTKLAELVGEEDKVKEWIKEWDKKLKNDREELDPLIKGKTATVLQQTPKGLMAFSAELGRGTEILYSGWGLKQPEDLKKATEKTNAISITPEEFDKYLGDFVVIAANGDQKAPFEDTNVWANTEAKKNDHVVKFDVSETQYNDPISLEKQREIFLKAFKEMK